MPKIYKRMLSLLIVMAMLAAMLPAAAGADGDGGAGDPLLPSPAVKPSVGGALQIVADPDDSDGIRRTLADQHGNPIQLRGMSTHGLQWFPEIINDNAFAALSNDWGANLIRLAMYVGEGGYADPDKTEIIRQRVIDGIQFAKDNDMYVIVDWHVHSPGDPNAEIYSGAMDFFDDISTRFPNDPHIIYELANEPNPGAPGVPNNATGWEMVKSYAEPIIDMLRDKGNQNIIIVGSPNWSQRPDLAANDPIDDANTMYSVHFYTGTHRPSTYENTHDPDSGERTFGNVMGNAEYAMENGVAVFATEWGTSEASGNNGPFLEEADVWLTFLNSNNISWANWSLTNKNETSGAFTPFQLGVTDATNLDPGDDQVWEPMELSVSGEYVRARIKGIAYEPIDRVIRDEFTTVVWDFDDGTTMGFARNGGSPPDTVTTTVYNENNTLVIAGLHTSNDVTDTGYWDNVRISADATQVTRPNILGAETLSIDVIVPTLHADTVVSIAAIPQSSTRGWVNPLSAVQVTYEDFTLQDDGSYKAILTITGDDSPNFAQIAADMDDSIMTNVILFVGTTHADFISLDNITVAGDHARIQPEIVHDPLGSATLPSDFEDGTRQGWSWEGSSGAQGALTIEQAKGSSAISWEVAYPDVKPSDGWASAPRIMLGNINTTRGNNRYLVFDFYLDPVRGNEGTLSINMALVPPSLGYWAQAANNFDIDLGELAQKSTTSDGLYHYEVFFDLTDITDNKVVTPDTFIRDITVIVADIQSNFAGRMYMDNVRFQLREPGYRSRPRTDDTTQDPVVEEEQSGNDETEVKAVTDENGRATAAITGEQLANAINHAVAAATASGSGKTVVALHVDAADNATAVQLSIPGAAIGAVAEQTSAVLHITTPFATIAFDQQALAAIVGAAGDDVVITVEKADDATIPQSVKQQIGDRPVFQFGVTSDGQSISQFGGNITVSVPYTPSPDEDQNAIVIYYINAQGELEIVRNSVYDPVTGTVTFVTDHFSQYAIGYNKINFSDVSGWYEQAVHYLAARGIVSGKETGQFAPADSVTRAELVQVLAGLAGADLTQYTVSVFADVSAAEWFSGAVQWASEHGLAYGHEGQFNPNTAITRQDVAVLLYRYMQYAGIEFPAGDGNSQAFADDAEIAGYARAAVAALRQAGVIAGKDGNVFDPEATATRAEAAQLIMQLIKLGL